MARGAWDNEFDIIGAGMQGRRPEDARRAEVSSDPRDERIREKQDAFIKYVLPAAALVAAITIAAGLFQHVTGVDLGFRLGVR
jgi:hypothetical protein